MKRQGGFTLIELVVVIVILGILAVTAAPKFLNLQSDARASSLQGLKGAMSGAAGIVYGKAAIEGKEQKGSTTLNDSTAIVFGYPAATSAGIGAVVIGLEDWAVDYDTADEVKVNFSGVASSVTDCQVIYKNAASSSATSTVTVNSTGC
ncbi:prepilin-type N-terminal cleavage/methylation domain-containing protein [Aliivibrio sp. EL58]|uniref:prepilin-type N-terminal cleavage/methylation domain-containing protein n=1 Tax=Aliivibrio sp. EL58 TaxID=2107582 RepID=UPI000EFC2E1C|nr:prepilin-type N-terminal cleavage/methylation domain-containing protein [Aliivibrio sp. EL58]